MCLPETLETVRRRAAEEGIRIDRRKVLVAGAAAALGATLPARAAAAPTRKTATRVKDLTHVFREGFPLFLGTPEERRPNREVVVTVPKDGFYGQTWFFWEHTATHMDVPAHFIEGGRTSPELTPAELIAPAVVIDISHRVRRDPDSVVTPDDIVRFERFYGRIPKDAVVCMYSGWEKRVDSEEDYRNVGPDGKQHFPGFGKPAVDFLLHERRINGIGVDTLSLDHGPSSTFDVHLTLLGADRYGIENLRNLKKIPPRGATLFVGLIPWEEGSGGPARVMALW